MRTAHRVLDILSPSHTSHHLSRLSQRLVANFSIMSQSPSRFFEVSVRGGKRMESKLASKNAVMDDVGDGVVSSALVSFFVAMR